ncbi:MAG: hypothetical protein LUH19_09460 [Lachnospiraceae bacterium]|nr:hypothetical protein [Lachnospiraceae bacterium]
MTKEEMLVRQIIGPVRNATGDFVFAVRETGRLLFDEGRPFEEILLTRDIYPVVAGLMKKNERTVARQIERVGNLCWDSMDEKLKIKYIGRPLSDIRSPQDMIFYLAFYCRFQRAFYEIMEEELGASFTSY